MEFVRATADRYAEILKLQLNLPQGALMPQTATEYLKTRHR